MLITITNYGAMNMKDVNAMKNEFAVRFDTDFIVSLKPDKIEFKEL